MIHQFTRYTVVLVSVLGSVELIVLQFSFSILIFHHLVTLFPNNNNNDNNNDDDDALYLL